MGGLYCIIEPDLELLPVDVEHGFERKIWLCGDVSLDILEPMGQLLHQVLDYFDVLHFSVVLLELLKTEPLDPLIDIPDLFKVVIGVLSCFLEVSVHFLQYHSLAFQEHSAVFNDVVYARTFQRPFFIPFVISDLLMQDPAPSTLFDHAV